MNSKNIENGVRKILSGQLKTRGLRLDAKDTDSIISSGILDSMSAIELVAALEKIFLIKIPSEDMTVSNFDSILKIADFVRAKLKSNK